MSKNIGSKDCRNCGLVDTVVIIGAQMAWEQYYAWEGEAAKHFRGMQIAQAECQYCQTRYMAWVWPSANMVWERPTFKPEWSMDDPPEKRFYDLSYRSTFNDEPGPSDIRRKQPPNPVKLLNIMAEIKTLLESAGI